MFHVSLHKSCQPCPCLKLAMTWGVICYHRLIIKIFSETRRPTAQVSSTGSLLASLLVFYALVLKNPISDLVPGIAYSKTCLKQPLKNRQNKGLQAMWYFLMQAKSIAQEHSAILLTCIIKQVSKTYFGLLKTGVTVFIFSCSFMKFTVYKDK